MFDVCHRQVQAHVFSFRTWRQERHGLALSSIDAFGRSGS